MHTAGARAALEASMRMDPADYGQSPPGRTVPRAPGRPSSDNSPLGTPTVIPNEHGSHDKTQLHRAGPRDRCCGRDRVRGMRGCSRTDATVGIDAVCRAVGRPEQPDAVASDRAHPEPHDVGAVAVAVGARPSTPAAERLLRLPAGRRVPAAGWRHRRLARPHRGARPRPLQHLLRERLPDPAR